MFILHINLLFMGMHTHKLSKIAHALSLSQPHLNFFLLACSPRKPIWATQHSTLTLFALDIKPNKILSTRKILAPFFIPNLCYFPKHILTQLESQERKVVSQHTEIQNSFFSSSGCL